MYVLYTLKKGKLICQKWAQSAPTVTPQILLKPNFTLLEKPANVF